MPDIAMQSQTPVDAAKSFGHDQGCQSAKQVEILKKRTNGGFIFLLLEKRQEQAQIHWHAAELKRKIPPVILAVVDHKKEKTLLVAFCQEQKQTTEKENLVGSSIRKNAKMV